MRHARPSGITLIIAMVMLVVIGFTSVAVMRNSLGSDQVAVGAKSQAQALQYAQAALRWCEMRWQSGAATPAVLPAASAPHWADFAHWHGPGTEAHAVTRADLGAAGVATSFPPHAPQCMAEQRALEDGVVTVTTARAASLDYAEDARGKLTNGAMVWVQSVALPQGGQRAWRQLLTPPRP